MSRWQLEKRLHRLRRQLKTARLRHPNKSDNVQAWAADSREDDDVIYVEVTCLACAQAHLVNPKTGKVLGSDDECAGRLSLDAPRLGPSPGFTPSF